MKTKFLIPLFCALVLSSCAADRTVSDLPRSGTPNPVIIRAQGQYSGSAIVTWEADKDSKEPFRIRRVEIKHPNYTRSIPKELFEDLRYPSFLFSSTLYANPENQDQLFLILCGGDGGEVYEALYLITPDKILRIGPPYRVSQ